MRRDSGENLPNAYLPWMEMALCRGMSDPEIFYSRYDDDIRDAKALCAACPAYGECLVYSLTRREPFGVWAGLTEKERGRLTERDRAALLGPWVTDPPVHSSGRAPKG